MGVIMSRDFRDIEMTFYYSLSISISEQNDSKQTYLEFEILSVTIHN